MPLKCETHKDRTAIAVCHHCSRPLCRIIDLSHFHFWDIPGLAKTYSRDRLCGYLLQDRTFCKEPKKPLKASSLWKNLLQGKTFNNESSGELATSCHCEDCLRADHPEMIPALESLKSGLSYSIRRPA